MAKYRIQHKEDTRPDLVRATTWFRHERRKAAKQKARPGSSSAAAAASDDDEEEGDQGASGSAAGFADHRVRFSDIAVSRASSTEEAVPGLLGPSSLISRASSTEEEVPGLQPTT